MPKFVQYSSTTEFSRRIARYIEETGNSIYKIAQITGLGRTAIHQVISGKLVPTKDFFEQLCTAFTITPAQKSELTELFLSEKIGHKSYYEQKRLVEIIKKLPQYYSDNNTPSLTYNAVDITTDNTVNGIMNVNRAVINLISRELDKPEPRIYSTIPFEDSELFEIAVQLINQGKKEAVFEHFIRIFKDGDNYLPKNMDTLESLLKMSINAELDYKPYSYYIHEDSTDADLPVFPYFAATSEYVIMLTGDFQSAVITDNNAILELTQKHIQKLRAISLPVIERLDENGLFEVFFNTTKHYTKSIEFQPCMTVELTLDIISKRLLPLPEHDKILGIIKESFFDQNGFMKKETAEQKAICYFSARGLENFAETGKMWNCPGFILSELSDEERLQVLKKAKLKSGTYFKLLDETKITVPDFLQIILLDNHKCIFSCLMEKKNFCAILSEQSLYNTLFSFFDALDEREFVLPLDETVACFDRNIRRVEERLNR